MDRPCESNDDRRQGDSIRADFSQPWMCGILFGEVILATTLVVGGFAAVSQPFGWQSASQFALCAVLGALLRVADRQFDLAPVASSRTAAQRHAEARERPIRF